jgi:hypothetical protein
MRRNHLVTGLAALFAAAMLAPAAASAGVVAPSKYDFGAVPVGTTATVKVSVVPGEICNIGENPPFECQPETAIAAGFASPPFAAGPTTCPYAVFDDPPRPGKCDVTFTFTPTAVGPVTQKVVAGTISQPPESARQLTLTLSGTGTPAAAGPGKKVCKPKRKKPVRKPVKAKTAAAKKKRKAKRCKPPLRKQKPKK